MSPRGGKRQGAGRPRKEGALSKVIAPRFTPAELDAIRSVLLPGETVSGFARAAVVGLVTHRQSRRSKR